MPVGAPRPPSIWCVCILSEGGSAKNTWAARGYLCAAVAPLARPAAETGVRHRRRTSVLKLWKPSFFCSHFVMGFFLVVVTCCCSLSCSSFSYNHRSTYTLLTDVRLHTVGFLKDFTQVCLSRLFVCWIPTSALSLSSQRAQKYEQESAFRPFSFPGHQILQFCHCWHLRETKRFPVGLMCDAPGYTDDGVGLSVLTNDYKGTVGFSLGIIFYNQVVFSSLTKSLLVIVLALTVSLQFVLKLPTCHRAVVKL